MTIQGTQMYSIEFSIIKVLTRNMIMCNYCGEWFHEECIGISLASLKKHEYYKCTTCKEEMRIEAIYEEG